MSSGKGANEASYIKHDTFWSLSIAQFRIAMLFLRPGDRMAIIDMHAGDGKGVLASQPDLFRGPKSIASAATAIRLADAARREGVICDVFLCERNRVSRRELVNQFSGVQIIGNHATLPDLTKYRWALTLNDPNGPRDHGDDVLRRIAKEVPLSDFLIVVNEIALDRIVGVKAPSANPKALAWSRDPARIAILHDLYGWRADPLAWARMIGRNHVLGSKTTYGKGAMRGRFFLVTNKPQRTPRGFTRFSIFGGDKAASSAPKKSAPVTERGSDRSNPSSSGAFGF